MGNNRDKRVRTAVAVAVLSSLCVTSPAKADDVDSPQFRKGLWTFQRTIEHIRQAPHLNQMLVQEQMTRCVDPSLAMKGIFASPNIGNCSSSKAQRIGNRYVFAKRCDVMGPVRTEITVQNNESYSELNELTVGAFPRRDLVIARRVGECDTEAGYQPATTSDGFQLSSSSSRRVKLD